MSYRNLRRLSQGLFLALFAWFCLATRLGEEWWQLRGWPVNWFLELDPLVALASLLATGALYAGLLWALLTVALTLLLGRFFCGWVCPLGALNHFLGWLAFRRAGTKRRLAVARRSPAQDLKYHLLAFLLAAAAAGLPARLAAGQLAGPGAWLALAGALALLGGLVWERARAGRLSWGFGLGLLAWAGLCLALAPAGGAVIASLQSGLLDPIPLLHRGVNLGLLPLLGLGEDSAHRLYQGGAGILLFLLAVLGLNFLRPRFYCRYLCPLGALLGLLARRSLFRLGKPQEPCRQCLRCQAACPGGADPAGAAANPECLLCLNCQAACPDGLIGYAAAPLAAPSAAGEAPAPDLRRRHLVGSLFGGALLAPALRLGGLAGREAPGPLRPPGSLAEPEFLARCLKCGQCMRVCPSGIIQPALGEAGLEGFWTPVLNFRLGTGGCLPTCTACGHLCPTAAIRPLSLDERRGAKAFAERGPLKLGLARVEQSRCLPWAYDRPCIVCQENCPVSPKAILTRELYQPLAFGPWRVAEVKGDALTLAGPGLNPGGLATGDYYAQPAGGAERRRILQNGQASLVLAPGGEPPAPGTGLAILVRLQRPVVDPAACIGCGACENVCPLKAGPAILVTPENQSRAGARSLLGGARGR